MTLYKPMMRLMVLAMLAGSSAGCSTKCTSWVVAGGRTATISECADKVERQVRCQMTGEQLSCECVQDGRPGKSFMPAGQLPDVHPSASELISIVNKGCNWQLGR